MYDDLDDDGSPLDLIERTTTQDDQRVAWLLGAGFSKPLGAPLFSELFNETFEKWALAWLQWRNCLNPGQNPQDSLGAYRSGLKTGLWSNAEECLTFLDEAGTSSLMQMLLTHTFGNAAIYRSDRLCTILSQFVAVATSFFVDRVSEAADLPETWSPYTSWSECLGQQDNVISFNYDRVIEEIGKRRESKDPIFLTHLHGVVPEWPDLKGQILANLRISGIAIPGPSKIFASKNSLAPQWMEARTIMQRAGRLVIIGYSFPVSDSVARSFILGSIRPETEVLIVLGPGPDGAKLRDMFKRQGIFVVRNTGLFAQQFLTEGTVTRPRGRFNHGIFDLFPT